MPPRRSLALAAAATSSAVAAASAPTAAAATSTAPASRRRARGLAVAYLHANARLEAKLPFGDHDVAGAHALLDDDFVAHALADGHRTLIDGAVVVDDEHELPVLPGLHGLARH